MLKVINHISQFTEHDENLLHKVAMCLKSVFIFVEENNRDAPKKKKDRKRTFCYLYKKLFDFIELVINEQDHPEYDEDMTQGPENMSLNVDKAQEDPVIVDDLENDPDFADIGPPNQGENVSSTRKEKVCLWNKGEEFQSVYNDFYDYYEEYAQHILVSHDTPSDERPVIGWMAITHSKYCVYKIKIYY